MLAKPGGDALFGTFCKTHSPQLIEILGYSGFDFCVIDWEHGAYDQNLTENLVRAAEVAGIAPIIRVPSNEPYFLSHALDSGADGVLVPQVMDAEGARKAVKGAKFAPVGSRGTDPSARSAKFSVMPQQEYFRRANEETMLIIQVEGEAALEELDDILQVPGLDAVFIGPYDLSQSLGIPGEIDHPRVTEAMETVVDKCRSREMMVATFADDATTGRQWARAGVQMIAASVDVHLFLTACQKMQKQWRETAD